MTFRGYIKLYRKIQDNPLYKEPRRFNRNEAWIDLLLMANHKPNEIIVDFKRVPIKRGEVFTSQLGLSKKWNWGIASVNRFLKLLKNENQISYKAESKYTIISILNWDKYQSEAETKRKPERKPERKPNGNHSETNKNDKNEKKELPKGKGKFPNPNIDFLISFLKEKNKLENLDGSVRANRQFTKLCLNKFGLEETKRIIEIGSADKFHRQNLTNFRYLYNNGEKIKRSATEEKIIKI